MDRTGTFPHLNASYAGAPAQEIWPVHRGSVLGTVKFTPISRKDAAQLWHRARQWDRETREKRRHGGLIGRTALTVLYCLIYDFLNWKTGRLEPTIETISQKCGVSPRAVSTALAKLKALGLINWQRRCETAFTDAGAFVLRQRSNAYALLNPKSWRGFLARHAPPPLPSEIGAVPPLPDTVSQAWTLLREGDRADVHRVLMSDQSDRLAVALASLGRSMGAV